MQKHKPFVVYLTLISIILFSFACQLPNINVEQAQNDALEATIVALQTQVAENQADPHSADLPQPTETQQPTPAPAAYRGFMVYLNGRFVTYDFDGNPLGLDLPAGEDIYYDESEVSVTADAVYYSQFGESSGVFRVDAQGTQQLGFINGGTDPVSIAVSPDGSKIAWSTSSWTQNAPATQVYMANIDGSEQRQVAEIQAGEQLEYWRVYHPYRWTEDGKLLYATGLTGIGGYILFWGYNGMYEYDPASDWTRTLVSDQERLGLCLSSVSHNRELAAIVCGDPDNVRVRQLGSGLETSFPILNEQTVAGSAKFSTDDTWLAYVIQTANYDDERGKVVVVPVDGSQAPRVIASFNGGTYTVESWVDAERFLVTRNDFATNTSSVWLMSRDGNTVSELTAGDFIGLYP